MPDSPTGLALQVVARQIEAEDVVSFTLARPDRGPLPPWAPGAHVDVRLGDTVRQYSLCGDPTDRVTWRIGVLREQDGRGGSRHLHDRVRPGSELEVSLPRNNFPLVDARHYVFVAGGIGITPLLPMIRVVQASGARWSLHYGARRRSRLAFLDELACGGARVRLHPEDECGLLPLGGILAAAPPDAQIYGCGPEPLLDALERAGAGRPSGSLHVERFRPRIDPVAGPDQAFDVLVASTGTTLRVGAGVSVLDTLDAAGLPMPSSCREGTCASCETAVLDGEIDHRDSVLSTTERESGKTMMICVSRAVSPLLVLDL